MITLINKRVQKQWHTLEIDTWYDYKISAFARLLLGTLINSTNYKPTIKRLAKQYHTSESTINRAIKELKKYGYLISENEENYTIWTVYEIPIKKENKTTEKFIEKYINTKYKIKNNYQDSWNEINNKKNNINMDLVAVAIKKLLYKNFLQTFYWQIIKEKLKHNAHFKCKLCGSGGRLHIHHNTYQHHGYEIDNFDDLIVLCNKCHSKFHDKIPL
jgi:DNA-binding transcriptional regulator YhcF (GntR family)